MSLYISKIKANQQQNMESNAVIQFISPSGEQVSGDKYGHSYTR